jgi:acetyltransferase
MKKASMGKRTVFDELDPLFHPRSVALIGASRKAGKIGRLFMDCFLDSGFRELYPVNPKESEILGLKAYPSVLHIPEPVDMAIVITPTASAPVAVKECVEKGVKTIVINTSGFAESGEKGKEIQDEMARVARSGGSRIIGPNCVGIYCPAAKLPYLLRPGKQVGSVGLVSQSGFFADYLAVTAAENGIGFSKAISCGNESDLNAVDFLKYLGEDPDTRTIVAYFENMRDGRRFYHVAREISKKKPIILLRGGLTEGGARVAVSHTGALAGSRPIWEGVVCHTGIVSAQSFEEVLDCLYAFHLQPMPKGNRVAIISGPGGIAVSTTDACFELGLDVPRFSPATAVKLQAAMPLVGGSIANPIDASLASLLGPHVYRDAIRILSDEDKVDMMLVVAVIGGECLRDLVLEATAGAANRKPLAVTVMAGSVESVARDRKLLLSSGISVYPDAFRAAKALHKLAGYARFREGLRERPGKVRSANRPRADADSNVANVIGRAAGEGRTVLSEHESREILRAYGIPVAREIEAANKRQFLNAVADIGYPAVVKAGGADLSHKTERGLVYLDIRTEKEAIAAFSAIQERRKGMTAPVLVQEMVKGQRELIVGLVRDPQFGPCVMIGLGGVFSEILNDNTFRPAPWTGGRRSP